jgi:hypothetical protein
VHPPTALHAQAAVANHALCHDADDVATALQALAVVAERHDLIAKLFADTARNSSGCYFINLFLDGEWCGARFQPWILLC